MSKDLLRRQLSTIDPGFPCPICSAMCVIAPYEYHREDVVTAIYGCSSCDFLFGRPVFISEQDQRQMDSIADAELYESNLLKTLHRYLNLNREVRKVRKILGPGQHRLLDIGCGTGWTTQFWNEKGFDVTGLEPSRSRREIAEGKYGFPVIASYLEDARVEGKYDVVVLRHIIEHFADPKGLVNKAASFVAPGGVMLIIVPNIRCLGRTLFDTNWTWVLPWHCNFFSPCALRCLVEQVGFKVLSSWQTPSPMYYHESFIRRFSYPSVKKFFSLFGPVGMLFFSPLALAGLVIGKGENVSVIAINGNQLD